MTLRDLSKTQLYNLRRRCEKERKIWWKKNLYNCLTIFEGHSKSWNAAYNLGFKAGLVQHPSNVLSP